MRWTATWRADCFPVALSRIDPTVETIPWDKRIWQQAKQRYRRPYIFSEQEFLCLLETALSFPSPRSPLRPQTLHMMLVLAYCAGLRIGEIVRLNVGDFDVDDRRHRGPLHQVLQIAASAALRQRCCSTSVVS